MATTDSCSESVEEMNTCASQITGVAALGPGISRLHPEWFVGDHWAGRLFSEDEPLNDGPRH